MTFRNHIKKLNDIVELSSQIDTAYLLTEKKRDLTELENLSSEVIRSNKYEIQYFLDWVKAEMGIDVSEEDDDV